MSNNGDELTGIFDHLTPDDFGVVEAGAMTGYDNDSFRQFIDNNITTVRTAFMASDGRLNPLAVLGDLGWSQTMTPTDDETLGQYVDRIRAEAKRLGARWVFVARKTLVGSYDAPEGAVIPDATDPEALAQAIEDGLLAEGMFCYAERTDADGQRESWHGMMRTEEINKLGMMIEGSSTEQTVDFFRGLLG